MKTVLLYISDVSAVRAELAADSFTVADESAVAQLQRSFVEVAEAGKGLHPSQRASKRKLLHGAAVDSATAEDMIGAADKLAQFDARAEVLFQGSKTAMRRLSVDAATLLHPIYAREIDRVRAILARLSALDVAMAASEEISCHPIIKRADEIAALLTGGLETVVGTLDCTIRSALEPSRLAQPLLDARARACASPAGATDTVAAATPAGDAQDTAAEPLLVGYSPTPA